MWLRLSTDFGWLGVRGDDKGSGFYLEGLGGLDFICKLDVCESSVFEGSGVDECCSAETIGSGGLVDMAGHGEDGLGFLDETADGTAADMSATGHIDSCADRRFVGYKDESAIGRENRFKGG